jgi:hypothetical protein
MIGDWLLAICDFDQVAFQQQIANSQSSITNLQFLEAGGTQKYLEGN